MRPLHPLHRCARYRGGGAHGVPGHLRVLRRRRSAGGAGVRAARRGLLRGGEEAHLKQAADAGEAQHHAPGPQGGHGDSPAEAARREAARGREGGDPQPGRASDEQRGAGGEFGDHQLRGER